MIKTLKRKFIITASISMFALMTALVLIMNVFNYREVVSESDAVLDVLSQQSMPPAGDSLPPFRPENFSDFVPPGMSPEVPYESRFFTVTVSESGEILRSDLSRIISVDDDSAKEYIDKALNSKSSRGFIGQFRYSRASDDTGTRIIFLDCGRKLDSFKSFLIISIAVGLFGCLVAFAAFALAAKKIVAPIAESYEKQKRFISDAGHEIKTPLTIIGANVDLLETEEEKEELTDIRLQINRLTDLTNNLIKLSKMDEAVQSVPKVDMPLSDIVNETVNSFRAPAVSKNIDLSFDAEPGISIKGSPDDIRQLVSILMDNAVKYSPEGGRISVKTHRHKKSVVLSVENSTEGGITGEDIKRVFDRFYRTDKSRNSETGGHGIGLSIAKAITEAHGGSIAASSESGNVFCIKVTLPVQ